MPKKLAPSKDDGRLLSARAYDKLLEQVTSLFESASHAENESRIVATWKIGARIAAARMSQRVGYHNGVLRELAADSGISVRVLQEAVAFHEAYEDVPKGTGLTWSHYRKLIPVSLPRRARLESSAIEHGWSARDLAAAIARAVEDETGNPTLLHRPTDPTYLYAATITGIIDGDTVRADIDLGFAVTRHEKLRLAHVDAPELKSKEGRAAKHHLTRLLHKAATLAITTERVDLHGRYVAHLFTSPVPTSIFDCFTSGTHVNAELVEAGHAVVKG